MKKIFAIILILVGIIIVAVFFLNKGRELSIEKILPSGALVYVRFDNVEEGLDAFTSTKFWEGVRAVNYKEVFEKIGARQKGLDVYDKAQKNLSSPAMQILLKKFFGREVAVAIYPTEFDSLKIEELTKISSNIFFITRLKPEVQFFDLFSNLAGKINQDIKTRQVSYRDHTINMLSIQNSNQEIGYVRIKDLLVFGVGEKAARTCLDVFLDEKRSSILEDQQHKLVKERYISGAEFFGYINVQLFSSGVKNQTMKFIQKHKDESSLMQKRFEMNLKEMQGFRAIGISGTYGAYYQANVNIFFDEKELSQDVRTFYECSPTENRSLSFVPKDVLGYQWSGCYDFKYYWDQNKKRLEEQAKKSEAMVSPGMRLAAVERSLNLSIEKDIIPLLGNEVGGYIADIDTKGIFPLPKILFFIKVNNVETASKLIDSIIGRQPFLRPKSEVYQGSTIKYVVAPIINTFQPGYTFFDSYLLIASNRQLLKDSINVSTGAEIALSDSTAYKEIPFGLDGKNNFIFFVHIDKVVNRAQELIAWGDHWFARRASKQEAFRAGQARRFADVKADIEERKAKLLTLKGELKTQEALFIPKDIEKEFFEKGVLPLEEIEKTITWNEKFLQSTERGIRSLEREAKKINDIQETSGYEISKEGEKRLVEIEEEIAVKRDKKKVLAAKIERFAHQKVFVKTHEVNAAIDREENALKASSEAGKELEIIIQEFENKPVLGDDAREALLEEMVKPLLEALSSLKIFALKIVLGENLLEMFFSLNME